MKVNKENATDQLADYQSYRIRQLQRCTILIQRLAGCERPNQFGI
jgi:hypothetical protein